MTESDGSRKRVGNGIWWFRKNFLRRQDLNWELRTGNWNSKRETPLLWVKGWPSWQETETANERLEGETHWAGCMRRKAAPHLPLGPRGLASICLSQHDNPVTTQGGHKTHLLATLVNFLYKSFLFAGLLSQLEDWVETASQGSLPPSHCLAKHPYILQSLRG